MAGPNRFELRDDVALPAAGAGQVLLRVKSTTMCGTDQKILAGQLLALDIVLERIGQIELGRDVQERQIRIVGPRQLDRHFRGLHGMGGAIDRHEDALEHGP